jgi:hypothetical protein
MRFGLTEAHGKGMAIQMNYLLDQGAFVVEPEGTFSVDFTKIHAAVRGLTHDILTIEAEADYPAARRLLDTLGTIRPPVQSALDCLSAIPVDIHPINER